MPIAKGLSSGDQGGPKGSLPGLQVARWGQYQRRPGLPGCLAQAQAPLERFHKGPAVMQAGTQRHILRNVRVLTSHLTEESCQ